MVGRVHALPPIFIIGGDVMVDIDTLRVLIMEDQYPVFTDEQLQNMTRLYDNIYQLAYVCCLSKASADKITIGPISIENDPTMWTNLAAMFLQQYQDNIADGSTSKSITGKVMRRADE